MHHLNGDAKPIESIGPGRDAGIVSYSLPKTLVRAVLPDSRSARPSQVVVESDAIADPVHTYVLEYQRNLFSSDQLTVTLAPHARSSRPSMALRRIRRRRP